MLLFKLRHCRKGLCLASLAPLRYIELIFVITPTPNFTTIFQ